MKTRFIFLTQFLTYFISINSAAQINVLNSNDGAILISPKGIIDNRTNVAGQNHKFIAIGDSTLFSNVNSEAVVAIGSKVLAKTTGEGYSVAIGNRAMYASTGGYSNVAIGNSSLYNNKSSNNTAVGNASLFSNKEGSSNTGIGASAMYYNERGNNNIAVGSGALNQNISGSRNIAIGNYALAARIIGGSPDFITDNIAIGHYAASSTKVLDVFSYTGLRNIALGNYAIQQNIYGSSNIAIGHNSLEKIEYSMYNVAVGNSSLLNYLDANCNGYHTSIGDNSMRSLTSGKRNTAVGKDAGNALFSGDDNTFLGYSSGLHYSTNTVSNSMALGAFSQVNVSNKVIIGNANVTQIGGYASWTNYSDKRLKENIVYTKNLGLDFINGLNTVTYNYKDDTNKRKRDGLIAQDIEEVLTKLGLSFSGLLVDNDSLKTMNVSYTELVIPLINAVQTLSNQNNTLKTEVETLKEGLSELKVLFQKKMLNQSTGEIETKESIFVETK